MEEYFGNELVKKFEEMIDNNEEVYFDTEEIEEVIIYYLEIGDFNFANLAVQYGLKIHPSSLEIKIKKLEVLLEWKEFTSAKMLIDELKEASMENTDFLVCYAKYYSSLGNPKKSIEICKRALELEEEENFLHNFIADELVNIGDPFSALMHYRKALTFDYDDDYALENIMMCYNELNKNDEAITFINDFIDHYPYSEVAWSEYATLYFNKKNYKECINGLEFLLAINDLSIRAYARLAAAHEAMKNHDKAILAYLEMLELEDNNGFTYYKIGLCYKAMKKPIDALQYLEMAYKEDPLFHFAIIELSYLYEEFGNTKKALFYAKEANHLDPNNLDYLKRLAFLYIDGSEFEKSVPVLESLVTLEPEKFYNWYAYSEVLMLLEEYENTTTLLLNATKKHNRAELYYQLSNCYYQLDRPEEGKKALDKALELDASLLDDMKRKYPNIEKSPKDKAVKIKKR